MMIKFLKFGFLPLCLLAVSFMASCEKEEVATENTLTQLFRPVDLAAEINGNNITFTWVPIKGASYSLEVRKNDAAENDAQVFSIDSTATFLVENLYSESAYTARIKAVSKDPAIKDSDYQELLFTTGIENIFYEVPDANISAGQVLLQWDPLKEVSAIVVSAEGVPDHTVTLSPAEISSGETQIGGLNPNTSYVFKIYRGDMLRGTISVMTLPAN